MRPSRSFASLLCALAGFVCIAGPGEARGIKEAAAAAQAKDYPTALAILLPMAESGNVKAMRQLTFLYWQYGPEGVRDDRKADHWLRRAATDDAGQDLYSLALYLQDKGLQRAIEESREAVSRCVGTGCSFMPAPVKYDNAMWLEAVSFFAKAAERGYPPAELRYGQLLAVPGQGVVVDLPRAAKLFQRVIGSGDRFYKGDAEHELAELYRDGRGVPGNPVLAATLEARARSHGYSPPIMPDDSWMANAPPPPPPPTQ